MNDELVTAAQAAELLGISSGQVHHMVKRGIIRPDPASPSTIKNRRFRKSDISALHEIRTKGFSLESAIVEARHSSLEARALRKELDRVKFLLGLDIPALKVDRDSLVSVLLQAEDALHAPPTRDKRQLLEWARTFHGLSETHFEAITHYTDQTEPWKVFIALGRKLCAAMDPLETRADLELHHIYMLLNAALRRVRQCAFFYIRNRYGKKKAASLMPDTTGCIHDDVIAMSFNTLLWDSPGGSPLDG